MKKICIIGGGASGMIAGITASAKGEVTVVEKADRIGKKILVTGNGKCNLSNVAIPSHAYKNQDYATSVIKRFDQSETRKFFQSIGVLTVSDESGRVYPRVGQASSVLNCLRNELTRRGVNIVTGSPVSEVKIESDGYVVNGSKYDEVIVATTPQNIKIGKHTYTDLVPSLTYLKTDSPYTKGMSGARIKARCTLYRNGIAEHVEDGEIQFKDNYLSGIVIFNLSSLSARKAGKWSIDVDLFPEYDEQSLASEIENRTTYGTTTAECFEGLINKFVSQNVIEQLGIKSVKELKERSSDVAKLLKAIPFPVTGRGGADNAQVTSGGIPVVELEGVRSKYYPGIFFAGEIIDVDGICGGYNLQWAWSSGRVAGEEA